MAEIFGCGFMRSNILKGNEEFNSNDIEKKYTYFKTQFKHVEIDSKHFGRKSKDLMTYIRKKRWHGEN